jgi:hypothetical protein
MMALVEAMAGIMFPVEKDICVHGQHQYMSSVVRIVQ